MAERQKQPWMARGKPVYSIIKHDDVSSDNNNLVHNDIIEDVNSMASNSDVESTDNLENEDTNPIDVHNQVDELSEENLNDDEVEDSTEDFTLDE